MMFLFLLPSVLFVIIYFFFKHIKEKNNLEDFPEAHGHPIFGNCLDISSPTAVLEVFTKFVEKYGKTVKVTVGPPIVPLRRGILTTERKLVEVILNSNTTLTKSENYKHLRAWFRNGLIISDGNYWRRHRKMLTPAFHFGILKEFVGTFENVGDIFVDKLKEYNGSRSVDLARLVRLCTLDIICETAMGTKINAQNSENTEYVKGIDEICRLLLNRCLNPVKIFDSTYWLTRDYYTQKEILKNLHNFTVRVINSKEKNQSNKRNANKMAFLDLMLKLSDDKGVRLTQEEISEEVDTFMFAGHDTTSCGISFTLFCLAEHPDIQEKVLQEQKELFGEEKNPIIAYEDLQNMKYLEKVIKEVLRVYPPVPIIGRYTTENLHFENRLIPKNTNILISLHAMHRDPDYFPEPEKFDPERFDNIDNFKSYTYMPFSSGPRNCIGQKFAILELKSVISKIIRHFEIRPAIPRHILKLSVEVVLKSTSGIKVGFKIRP